MRFEAGAFNREQPGVGWIPLLAGGMVLGAGAWEAAGWLEDKLKSGGSLVLQTLGLQNDPRLTPTQPQFQPPAAPQTATVVGTRPDSETPIYGGPMVNWSLDWLYEAEQQRLRQSQIDDAARQGNAPDPSGEKQEDYSGLLLLGGAVLGGLILISAVKR